MKFLYSFTTLLIFTSIHLFSQEAAYLEKLSKKEKASYQDAVYLVAAYTGKLSENSSFNDHIDLLKKEYPKLKEKKPERILRIGDLAYLICTVKNIKGGIWYSVSKSGRYATRELIYKQIFPQGVSEWDIVSGMELLNTLGKVAENVK